MHLSDSELNHLVDGELPAADARRLRLHLEECAACAARLRGVELRDRRIAEWLGVLDHPVPRLDPETLMARVPRRSTRPGLLAASLGALFVAAVAAAAVIPGSPVPRLVERAVAGLRGGQTPDAGTDSVPAAAPSPSGVSFVPHPELEIAFRRSQPEGTIRISLVDASEVRVRELGGTSAYSLDPAALVIDNRSPGGSYEIQLPKGLRRARVRIGDRVVFEKDGGSIASRGSLDVRGGTVVPFGGEAEGDSTNFDRRSAP